MTLPTEHGHAGSEPCDEAIGLYTQALSQGSIARSAAAHVPCLADGALLVPDPHDSLRLRPVPPTAGLAHLLHPLARQVFDQVRAIDLLAKSLVPLTSADREPVLLTTLHGRSAIQASINGSARDARDEILTIQPGSTRTPEQLQIALSGTLPTVARGVRVRHIYQHSARYSADLKAYVAQLPSGLLEVRTVERAIDRLILFDRTVAYLPADPDGTAALEIRHPALVRYLAAVYETLWAGATPFTQHLPTALPGAPVTAVQQSIARLLIDGCTDQAAADELGISVRTCRAHIAKLMHTLDATSRTHLGALLVRSGIAEPTR
ncbi:helix-turn-helix transcriptional regulator [Streptomyces sp. CB02460]|uniref:helix-turn-helix transcriptional regulator n=1 Tax=Streptomyces sp. CB02460 TaxID=1703941 RepID=UPI00093C1DA6|nr:helix-turn-helix transcriptional regulator [Streptomyces sp. CB02460]OKJ73911.1 hypothetical protein AMK30_15470 [Streptomyces sp. CB02460]